MYKNIKKIFAVSIISFLFLQVAYVSIVEPEIAVAATAPDSTIVTLNVDAGISISNGADVTMAPNIATGQSTSIGSSSWTVITNNNIGYKLDVKASASPALVSGGNSFADYTEGSAGVPELWSVGAGAKEFGYSAYGSDTTGMGIWGSGSTCGSAGAPNTTTMKYVGFKTTDKTIATSASPTSYSGTATTICFAVQQNGVYASAGTYTATITGTATTL